MTKYQYQDKLESQRLVTRMLSESDIPAWSDFFADPEAVEFFPANGIQTNQERSKEWIEFQLARYAENRYGLQALIDKKTNDFVGLCGLLLQDVEGKPEIEVGYHIKKKYWGQGYAPEAARLFIDYAFKNNLTDSVVSIIDKGNIKSQRVADKNGLRAGNEIIWTDLVVYIYRINKSDWKK